MIKDMVEGLLQSLEGSTVSEVEYEANGIRIRLVRRLETPAVPPLKPVLSGSANELEIGAGQETHKICASMHGTFYRAPTPDEPPFVELGQRVIVGAPLGVLEAMKMLHEIEADIAGTITKVLVEDGATVEPGTALFIMDCTDV